jgi:glycosyltransferase involved in cell wall biosynthesis
MKVILLTQYYPPERGAPQNRLSALARSLKREGAEVTVLTGMPNYPEMRIHDGYRGRWSMEERMDDIRVVRSWLMVSTGRGIIWRLGNYFSFVFSALITGLFKLKRSDLLIVESPPLFLGITAMLLARAKGAELVFNVSDLWPESAVKLGLVTNPLLIGMSTKLELMCYRRAALVTGQTQGIVDDIRARVPGKAVRWVPNGIDLDDVERALATSDRAAERTALNVGPEDLVLFYAGIIGHAQGLEVVLDAAHQVRDLPGLHILLIGAGPVRAELQQRARELDLPNLRFIEGMNRSDLLRAIVAMDAAVVPLRKSDLFKGAIPSKIFEALALGKPLLLGVEGEAHELFIDQAKAGIAFAPEDGAQLAQAIRQYHADRALMAAHGAAGARYVRERFDRAVIGAGLCAELRRVVDAPDGTNGRHA